MLNELTTLRKVIIFIRLQHTLEIKARICQQFVEVKKSQSIFLKCQKYQEFKKIRRSHFPGVSIFWDNILRVKIVKDKNFKNSNFLGNQYSLVVNIFKISKLSCYAFFYNFNIFGATFVRIFKFQGFQGEKKNS